MTWKIVFVYRSHDNQGHCLSVDAMMTWNIVFFYMP